MKKVIQLCLPYPPSVNHGYRLAKNRRTGRPAIVKTDETNAFQWKVKEIVLKERANGRLEGKLSVHYRIAPPDRRRRDIANLEKFVSDALQYAGVFHDDHQLEEVLISRAPVIPDGMILVTLRSSPAGGIFSQYEQFVLDNSSFPDDKKL